MKIGFKVVKFLMTNVLFEVSNNKRAVCFELHNYVYQNYFQLENYVFTEWVECTNAGCKK